MECIEYYNILSEADYKQSASDHLTNTFKAITFTYVNVFKILSKASKKCVLQSLGPEAMLTENSSPFERLMGSLKGLSKDIEQSCKTFLMTFQSGLKEETENLPASLLGLIDDSINEYTDAMRTDFTGHKRSSNFIRQLNSIVDILIGLNDLEQNKSYMTRLNKEKEE